MHRPASLALSLPLAAALLAFSDRPANAVPSACDAVAGNLVQNCGFETTGGWNENLLTNQVGPHTGNYSNTVSDSQYGASVTQTISGLSIGTSYSFAFWYMDVFSNGAIFSATIDSITLLSPTTSSDSWAQATGSFVATGASMVLTIGIQAGGYYGALDDVSIVGGTPVPEPASALLLGAGLASLAGLRRRR